MKLIKKVKVGPTDQLTDGRTKQGVDSRARQVGQHPN